MIWRMFCLLWSLLPALVFAAETRNMPVQSDGWNGADAAYNRLLSNGKRIWVFGDTLMGEVANGKRISPTMPRNSVAVEDAEGQFRYYAGIGEQGVFANAREDEWYWPADFVVLEDTAYFFLRRIQKTGEGAMDFAVTGTDIAKVHNVSAPLQEWQIAYSTLTRDSVALGVAAAQDADYVYLLANAADGEHAFYLARMAKLAMKMQVLTTTYYDTRRKQWQGSEPKTPLLKTGAPEASLARNEDGTWRLIYSGDGLSADVLLRTAPAITGPWSEPKTIMRCPEVEGNIICYAGKEVHGAAQPTITYSVNSLEPADLEADADLYIPRIVTLDAW